MSADRGEPVGSCLLSACLITRDEEANIGRCLRSLAGLVDEVVVYDTGSVDRTPEVATRTADALGVPLTVIIGYWDDDFSRARNESLARCRGKWILWVDADEEVLCQDPDRVRALLASLPPDGPPETLQVAVESVPAWPGATVEVGRSTRVLLAGRCRFAGRVHEQVRLKEGGSPPSSAWLDSLAIRHHGYAQARVDPAMWAAKAERNLRLARLAVEEADPAWRPHELVSLGRALALAGEQEEARTVLEEAISSLGLSPTEVSYACQSLVEIDVSNGRFENAERHVKRLWRASDLPALASYLDAAVSLGWGESLAGSPSAPGGPGPPSSSHQAAFRLRRSLLRLERMGDRSVDDAESVWGVDRLVPLAVRALEDLGHISEAARLALATLSAGALPMPVAELAALISRSESPLAELAEAVPPWLLGTIRTQLDLLDTTMAAELAAALDARFPDGEAPSVSDSASSDRGTPVAPDATSSNREPPKRGSLLSACMTTGDEPLLSACMTTGDEPLLSACMITRDEEENIPVCIASLAGLVDEVVVYDTGSVDGTRRAAERAAEQAGLALVWVDGYWDDDFSRARNESLARCRGKWILWVDADETVQADDPTQVRHELARLGQDVLALQVTHRDPPAQHSLSAPARPVTRLFRRGSCLWAGRMHEQLVRVPSGDPVPSVGSYALTLLHQPGALSPDRVASRRKRNLRISEQAAAMLESDPFPSLTLVSLGRARAEAGDSFGALDAFERALAHRSMSLVERRYALSGAVRAALGLLDLEKAAAYLRDLWRACDLPVAPSSLDWVLEMRRFLCGKTSAPGTCLRRAGRIPPFATDDEGSVLGPDRTRGMLVESLERAGHISEAARLAVATLSAGALPMPVAELAALLSRSESPLAELAEAVPPWLLGTIRTQLDLLDTTMAAELAAALDARFPDGEAPSASDAASSDRGAPVAPGAASSDRGAPVAPGAASSDRETPEPGPLLSACMITRDEEENIPACIASLAGLVDEVVVYDTGSVDGTRQAAEQAAEQVGLALVWVDGYWDDDFSRARNESLARCRGKWILWVDADETVQADDPREVRHQLDSMAEDIEGIVVRVQDPPPYPGASALGAPNLRLFRRLACRWAGRFHEQVRRADDGSAPRAVRSLSMAIVHSGYSTEALGSRSKAERNLALAEAAVRDAAGSPGFFDLLSLGRARAAAGMPAEALESFDAALADPTISIDSARIALECAQRVSLELGAWEKARDYLARIWRAFDLPAVPLKLDALCRLIEARSNPDAALASSLRQAVVRRVERAALDPTDEDGWALGLEALLPLKIEALAHLGDDEGAAEVALAGLRVGNLCASPAEILALVIKAGIDVAALADAVPPWLAGTVLEALGRCADSRARSAADLIRLRFPESFGSPEGGPSTLEVPGPDSGAHRPEPALEDGPLLSASLIVRDEEENIPACIASLAGLVDEVVVYDTGSVDGTRQAAERAAEQAGLALVWVDGYWDDDFSRARNESLARCRGKWVLVVDADETVEHASGQRIREHLRQADPREVCISVPVDNAAEVGPAVKSYSVRLFRRAGTRWHGRLHEQVVLKDGQVPPRSSLDLLRIVHGGYRGDRVPRHRKASRNVTVSRASLHDVGFGQLTSEALLGLARSLHAAGRTDEALQAYREVATHPSARPQERAYAAEAAVEILCGLGRPSEAASLLPILANNVETPNRPRLSEAVVELHLGNVAANADDARTHWNRCLEILDAIDPDRLLLELPATRPGLEISPKAQALANLGRFRDAVEAVLVGLRRGVLAVRLDSLLRWMRLSETPVTALTDALDERSEKAVQEELFSLDDEDRSELSEALERRQTARSTDGCLVSASLIVRDEEENIPACIASLAGLVDEVVVYDTGSVDGTRQAAERAAEQAGLALVWVDGYWDDDFSRARNESLARCRGKWVLVVDADERARFEDADSIRRDLANVISGGDPLNQIGDNPAADFDAFHVSVDSLQSERATTTLAHVGIRMLRKDRCHYRGRLHEAVYLFDGRYPEAAYLPGLRILHLGYMPSVMNTRAKTERNLRIARGLVAEGRDDKFPGSARLDLARTLSYAGLLSEAREVLEELLESGILEGSPLSQAIIAYFNVCLDEGNYSGATSALARLQRLCEVPTLPSFLAARLAYERARAAMDKQRSSETRRWLEEVVRRGNAIPEKELDEFGNEYGGRLLAERVARAMLYLGRPEAVVDATIAQLEHGWQNDIPLKLAVEAAKSCGTPFDRLAAALPPFALPEALATCDELGEPSASELRSALARMWPDDERVGAP